MSAWRDSLRVLGIVLAGGEGKRLWPLTADRAKPAVPVRRRATGLIDFVLSNLVNAGYLRICVLTQYKSHSLDRHITTDLAAVDPARQLRNAGARRSNDSARGGTRAAPTRSCRSFNLIYDDQPDYIVVFGADHVYRMDPRQMVEQTHRRAAPASPWPASACRAARPAAFG